MAKTTTQKNNGPVSVRLYPEQKKKLKKVSNKIRLSEQDCFRKALDFGLPVLVNMFAETSGSRK